jgi:class 3 adenylate cyclase
MGGPSGTVTFLFTDIEGSTRRWEDDPEAMRSALAAHDEVLRAAIEGHGGWLFKHTGDGVCAAGGLHLTSCNRIRGSSDLI